LPNIFIYNNNKIPSQKGLTSYYRTWITYKWYWYVLH